MTGDSWYTYHKNLFKPVPVIKTGHADLNFLICLEC